MKGKKKRKERDGRKQLLSSTLKEISGYGLGHEHSATRLEL